MYSPKLAYPVHSISFKVSILIPKIGVMNMINVILPRLLPKFDITATNNIFNKGIAFKSLNESAFAMDFKSLNVVDLSLASTNPVTIPHDINGTSDVNHDTEDATSIDIG